LSYSKISFEKFSF